MSSIDALLRPVSKEDELRALADSLRKRKRAADFFAMSTIKPLAAMGKASGEQVMDSVKQQGLLREALAQRASNEEQKRLAMEAAAARASEASAHRDRMYGLAKERNEIARTKADEHNFAKPSTQKERAAFESGSLDLVKFNQLADSFQESYSGVVPLMGGVENIYHRAVGRFNPLQTKKSKEEGLNQAEWWSDYKEYAELVRRHGLFGSALSKNESAEWRAATITPNDDPELVKRKLETQREFIRRKTEKAAASAILNNYDPQQIRVNFSDSVNLDALSERLAAGNYSMDEAEATRADTDDNEVREGDIIENEAGERLVLRNGQWEPL